MSEMLHGTDVRNSFDLGNSRNGDWQTLRLLVTRNRSSYLTVAMIEVPKHGHPRLDARIRGMQVHWSPEPTIPDLRLYALAQALAGVSQTRP